MNASPQRLAADLARWYQATKRSLPWRSAPSPYHVLLSELMLQQTRVETVLPYFARFTERWPTLDDLAAATEDEVVEAWAGLGYYSRARNLHRCAQAAVARGGLPDEVEGLRKLPGIGPYTAGAIASIAFGRTVPLVDGNVERVLSRLDGREADPRSSAGRKALWARAAELVEARPSHVAPGDLNQALMELGATVCTPKAFRCEACPWQQVCAAAAEGTVAALPKKAPKKPPVPIRGAAVVVRSSRGLLMGRRAPGGLLSGLWEPPRVDEEDEAQEALVALLGSLGLEFTGLQQVGEVVHVFSHRRLTCGVWTALAEGVPTCAAPYDNVEWRSDALQGASTLAKKIVRAAEQPPLLLAADGRVEP